MHRTISITVPPHYTETLVRALEPIKEVIQLSVDSGASRKPPGDIVSVQVMNRGADLVMRKAMDAHEKVGVVVVTAEACSVTDPAVEARVDEDTDDALWEELETLLRSRGRVSFNYLALMLLGGAIASPCFVQDASSQAVTIVSASIIAPSFEPAATAALGLALQRGDLLRVAGASLAGGYAALMTGAALLFSLLRMLRPAIVNQFVSSSEVQRLGHFEMLSVATSLVAAIASALIITTYRESVLAGPVVALVIVPTGAMIGVAAAIGDWGIVGQGMLRLALDTSFIVICGWIVMWCKQRFVHQREPLS